MKEKHGQCLRINPKTQSKDFLKFLTEDRMCTFHKLFTHFIYHKIGKYIVCYFVRFNQMKNIHYIRLTCFATFDIQTKQCHIHENKTNPRK